jgi:ketosteroid isomerase-like protein
MQFLSSQVKFPFSIAATLLSLCAATASFAEVPATDGNARSLAAAESAFAQEALAKGTRSAFLDALSDDGVVFQPGPQNGRKAWEARKDGSGVLEWQPVLAVVAASGDFGYTTGPWTFRKTAAEKQSAACGQFVSIWRREAGKWKLLFDLGTENPPPTVPAPALQLRDNRTPNESAAAAHATLLEQERSYSADRGKNFPTWAADDVRLYLPEKFPVIGKAEAIAALKDAPNTITFREPKGEVASSGDLGFAWGEYAAGQTAEATGYYLHIWRKNEQGQCRLALDLLHPR